MRGRIPVIAAIRIWWSFAVKSWAISGLPSPGERRLIDLPTRIEAQPPQGLDVVEILIARCRKLRQLYGTLEPAPCPFVPGFCRACAWRARHRGRLWHRKTAD